MKELRFQLDGVWRFAFAFDLQRSAIVLCGGDKENENSKRFYKQLIETADRRFTAHIASLRKVARSRSRAMKNLNQIIDGLSPERRAKIEGRARQLIGEEMALQQLRKARKLTQKQMARALKIGQDSVSRLESRSDLLISTLQSYVEAMGGELKIIVEFKEGSAVISGLGATEPVERPNDAAKKAKARRKRHLELAHSR